VIYAWDKACIDYHLWHRLKHNSEIYFTTIEKVFNELKSKMEERKSWARNWRRSRNCRIYRGSTPIPVT
jgi:hypothetical protein